MNKKEFIELCKKYAKDNNSYKYKTEYDDRVFSEEHRRKISLALTGKRKKLKK